MTFSSILMFVDVKNGGKLGKGGKRYHFGGGAKMGMSPFFRNLATSTVLSNRRNI